VHGWRAIDHHHQQYFSSSSSSVFFFVSLKLKRIDLDFNDNTSSTTKSGPRDKGKGRKFVRLLLLYFG
jgi:hypothetical protein